MKKCSLKCSISFVLAFILLLLVTSVGSAVQPRYIKIVNLSATLESISLAGRATCSSLVSILDATCSVTITAELQQSGDGTSWDTIKTWSSSGNRTAETAGYWYVDKGYGYRVLATATVYNSSGNIVETASATSLVREY